MAIRLVPGTLKKVPSFRIRWSGFSRRELRGVKMNSHLGTALQDLSHFDSIYCQESISHDARGLRWIYSQVELPERGAPEEAYDRILAPNHPLCVSFMLQFDPGGRSEVEKALERELLESAETIAMLMIGIQTGRDDVRAYYDKVPAITPERVNSLKYEWESVDDDERQFYGYARLTKHPDGPALVARKFLPPAGRRRVEPPPRIDPLRVFIRASMADSAYMTLLGLGPFFDPEPKRGGD